MTYSFRNLLCITLHNFQCSFFYNHFLYLFVMYMKFNRNSTDIFAITITISDEVCLPVDRLSCQEAKGAIHRNTEIQRLFNVMQCDSLAQNMSVSWKKLKNLETLIIMFIHWCVHAVWGKRFWCKAASLLVLPCNKNASLPAWIASFIIYYYFNSRKKHMQY